MRALRRVAVDVVPFAILERDGGGELLPGLPLWWSVLVIPLGFGLMALRFVLCVFWPPTPGPVSATAGEGSA